MRSTIITLVLLIISLPALAQEHDCLSKCLARGGLPEHCSQSCGFVTHGSVNVEGEDQHQDPISETLQDVLAPANDEFDETKQEHLQECIAANCATGNSSLPLEECIKNCVGAAVISSSSGAQVPGSRGGDGHVEEPVDLKAVDFSCFKQCRSEGESPINCKIICEKEN